MGWGDVRYCFAMAILVITSPDCCRVMYCYSTFLFHYSYYSSSSTHVCPLDFSEMPCSIPSTRGSPLQSFNELYIVRWNIDREQVCVN